VSQINLAPVISQMKASAFQVIPPLGRAKGVFSFELIATEHSLPHRFWVSAKIQYFCNVATLTRQINAHSHFSPSDLKWERKEITFMNDVPATTADANGGLARMGLSPGTILLRSHLEREMALKFGDQVDLILGDDGVAIMTKGIAQQNGFVGDTVKVRSLATDKVIDGIITARGVVNVRY
jgi:flagella basal body P-ring formation protein FlgA